MLDLQISILIISIYAMLEVFEFITTSKGDNLYRYITYNIELFRFSFIKFLFSHLSFMYLLFVIIALEFYEVSIVIVAMCKFLDIATKLYFANKINTLENLKPHLEQIKLTLWIKLINPIIYTLLFSFGIYSIAKYA